MNATKIEWATATVQAVTGCTKVSDGCKGCYAMRRANLLAHNPGIKEGRRAAYAQAVQPVPLSMQHTGNKFRWSGRITVIPGWEEEFAKLARARLPRRVFIQSMGDLFHEGVPFDLIGRVFNEIILLPQHTFMVLTKRPARMHEFFTTQTVSPRFAQGLQIGPSVSFADGIGVIPNLWLGVTAENQPMADERIPWLLRTPAAKRFVSAEPLLGPLNVLTPLRGDPVFEWLTQYYGPTGFDPSGSQPKVKLPTIGWIIAGGETGPGARPMHPDWARSLRDQCQAAGVPFFFKSWGDWAPWDDDNWSLPDGHDDVIAHDRARTMNGTEFLNVGKKAAGNKLDGRTWLEVPA
jgi:protein gp37